MNKKAFLLLLFGLTIIGGAFAQQFNLTGQWSMQGNDRDVLCAAHEGQVMHLGGFGTEFVMNHMGFGTSLTVNFDESTETDLSTNWDFRLFMSYHLFRDTAFLDPFVQAGGGVFGNVRVTGDCSDEEIELVGTPELAFYPYLAAGLGMRFRGGFYASGQFNWRPVAGTPPSCDTFDPADLRKYEVVLALGYSFGAHR